jgi:signal transduction histidine kinase
MSDLQPPSAGGQLALPSVHSVQRSTIAIGTTVLTGALFLAGLWNPTISKTVGVSFAQGVLVVSVFLSAVALASLAYFRLGATSRLYLFFDYLEGFVLSWGTAFLIQASSTVHSFFWVFHGVQVFATAIAGYSLVYFLTVCVGPAYLVAVFLFHGETTSAWFSAIGGISGMFVYLSVARLSSERDGAMRREAALRQELGRVLVARERARISRDLHDNVATELTALVWKVREISGAIPGGTYTSDIVGVAERLRSVIGDLHNVVLALREPELSFNELELLLQRRCRELCGATELQLTLIGRPDAEELSLFHDQVLPICFELVSNASRHAQARHIELELRIGPRLELVVSDDGTGLPPSSWQGSQGGLHSVRQRVEKLNGAAHLEPTAAGTRIAIELPRPLQ